MISNRHFAFFFFLYVFQCLPFKCICQDAHDILNSYFAAIITKDGNNWEDISTIYIEGLGSHDLKQFNQATPTLNPPKSNAFKHYIEVGNKEAVILYADTTYAIQLSKLFVSKKKVIILLGGHDPIVKEPGQHQRFFEFHAILVKRLVQEAVSLRYNGLRSPGSGFNGKYQEVEIVTKDMQTLLYFSRDTHLLEFWTTIIGDNLPATTHYEDYHNYQGYLIPRSAASFRNGMMYYWSRVGNMALNTKLDPTVFDYKRELK